MTAMAIFVVAVIIVWMRVVYARNTRKKVSRLLEEGLAATTKDEARAVVARLNRMSNRILPRDVRDRIREAAMVVAMVAFKRQRAPR